MCRVIEVPLTAVKKLMEEWVEERQTAKQHQIYRFLRSCQMDEKTIKTSISLVSNQV